MAVNTQFSIAVHLMAGLGFRRTGSSADVTSTELAKSVNTSPSFVRRVLAKLSKAGLVQTTIGKSGFCSLARKPEEISLLEIYRAVEAPKAFAIHDYEAQSACRVSCHIKSSMNKVLERAQKSFEAELKEISLAEVISDISQK